VDKDPRQRPEPAADEKAMLSGWLDWQRQTVRLKCTGLSDVDARRQLLPDTSPQMSIAWLVYHLTSVELGWFVRSFLGEPTPSTPSLSEALPVLLDAYDAQCEISRQIVADHDLDELEQWAPEGLPLVSLRWILGHVIEETARHLGHLDILRELTDGTRGY
jgi:uncharacterized damage-inducible protein DinB